MNKIKMKPGTGWAIVGIIGSVISLVAGNKKDDSNKREIAEMAANILEERQSKN